MGIRIKNQLIKPEDMEVASIKLTKIAGGDGQMSLKSAHVAGGDGI